MPHISGGDPIFFAPYIHARRSGVPAEKKKNFFPPELVISAESGKTLPALITKHPLVPQIFAVQAGGAGTPRVRYQYGESGK